MRDVVEGVDDDKEVIVDGLAADQVVGEIGADLALDYPRWTTAQVLCETAERLTPEERFINELLLAETPREATSLLRKNVAKVNQDLVKKLNELAESEEKRGNKPTADRLRQLARESGAMLF